MDMQPEPAIDAAVLEQCRQDVDASAARYMPADALDGPAAQLLQAMLGFYQQQMAALGWGKTALVSFAKGMLRGMGVPHVPAIDAGVARKLGLVGYGLEVLPETRERPSFHHSEARHSSRDQRDQRDGRRDGRSDTRRDERRSPFQAPITRR